MAGAYHQREPATGDTTNELAPRNTANVIDIATRSSRPHLEASSRSERYGTFASLAVVAVLVGLTIWTIKASQSRPPRSTISSSQQPVSLPSGITTSGLPEGYRLDIDLPQGEAQAPASGLPAPDLSPVLAEQPALTDAPLAAEPVAKPPAAPNPTVVYQSDGEGSAVAFAFEPDDGPRSGNARGDVITLADAPRSKPAPAKAMGSMARSLGKGTLVPAILETAIDSQVAGGVRAVVSNDVLSPDGKRALVPRSSRLIGHYKARKSAGQTSAYVVWTQIVRPDGTKMDIPSPTAGANERQFFDRFGSARLVSVIAAPTGVELRARQGEPVRVLAAKDVDLSNDR